MLVCFGGLDGRTSQAPFEFAALTANLPVHRVFLRDTGQCWYQRGLPGLGDDVPTAATGLRSLLAELRGTRTTFVGTSSGGFASVLFGVVSGADRMVAFSPQASLHRWDRLRAHDRRWSDRVRVARRASLNADHLDLVGLLHRHPDHPPVTVHFGSGDPRDSAAAHRIGACPGVELRAHPGGHLFVRSLRHSGELESLIRTAVMDEPG